MPKTVINIETAKAALANLQSEAPQENELNNIFIQGANELKGTSTKHDGFMDNYISQLEPGGDLYLAFDSVNQEYTEFLGSVSTLIAEAEKMEQKGNVNPSPSGGGTTGGGAIPSSDVTGGTIGPGNTPGAQTPGNTTGGNVDGGSIGPGNTPGAQTPGDTTGGNVGGSTIGAGNTPGAAAAGAAAAGAVVADGDIGGLGSPDAPEADYVHDNNPFGSHSVSGDTINGLTPEEQTAVRQKLKDLGFSDSDIDAIMRGEGSVPSVEINPMAQSLEEALAKDPSLRQQLIAKYGFDIFNPDGTVDKDRLALALMMDNRSGMDDYSLMELLKTKYGLNIVNPTDFTNLSSRLERLLGKYPDLREKLMTRYGFDIFNPDGSINKDKLALAMLMDSQNGNDNFDILAFLKENYGDDELTALLGSVVKPVKAENATSSGVGVVPVAAGVGALGAVAGGTALLLKKNKDDEENEEKTLDDDFEENPTTVIDENKKDEKQQQTAPEEDKEWLHGLGLGLGANPAFGIDAVNKATKVEEKLEKESEYIRFDGDTIKPVKAEAEKKTNWAPLIAAGAAIGVGAAKAIKDKKDEEDKEETSLDEKEGFEW